MKENLFTLQGSIYFYAVTSFKVGIQKPDMKKLPGAITWFRAYRLNTKTFQFWVLRIALEVECKLLITKHLLEGEENQGELHDKNIHHKPTFQSKCMARRNGFGSKLQAFVLILTLNSANVLTDVKCSLHMIKNTTARHLSATENQSRVLSSLWKATKSTNEIMQVISCYLRPTHSWKTGRNFSFGRTRLSLLWLFTYF